MATTRTFNAMLNQYLPERLLKEELIKRDYFLQKVEKDNSWKGGTYIVPFKANGASSVAFGALTGSTDIAESEYIRGTVSTQIEVWGSMIFNQRDLMEHDGKIPESTFLRVLPDTVDDFMQYMKEAVSCSLLDGPQFATVTDSTNAATGIFIVDRPERFCLGQKTVIDDDDSGVDDAYVIAINMNTSAITFSDTRGGSAFNFSAYTSAQNAVFYHPGAQTATFQSAQNALLSLTNGGGTTIHGQTKTAYPFLQAINYDGSSVTAVNILDKIFDAYVDIRRKARGNAKTVLMSYKHLGSVLKALETQKGGYKVTAGERKTSLYGWDEIEINSVKGSLTVVGIQEMLDGNIFFIDWGGVKFATNGFFKKRIAPDGKQYYEVRNTTGYQYILDTCVFGELIWNKPGNHGVMHSISY